MNFPVSVGLIPKCRPSFSLPQQISCFSFDEQRCLHFDDRQLKMLKPHLNDQLLNSEYNNLNAMRSKFVRKPDDMQEHLDALLATLVATVSPTEKRADLVTWRGILTKFMATPYRRHELWDLNVLKRNVRIKPGTLLCLTV